MAVEHADSAPNGCLTRSSNLTRKSAGCRKKRRRSALNTCSVSARRKRCAPAVVIQQEQFDRMTAGQQAALWHALITAVPFGSNGVRAAHRQAQLSTWKPVG